MMTCAERLVIRAEADKRWALLWFLRVETGNVDNEELEATAALYRKAGYDDIADELLKNLRL